ncbi:MAG: HAMP domain-containing histidine kinase [Archangium sp.]|nr:HAMP domain-containing histidine kinase [Archangium sp.]
MTLRLKLMVLVAGLLTLVLTALALVVSAGMKRWTLEVVDAELSRRALALADSIHQEHGRLERAGDDDDGPTVTAHGWPFRVEREGGAVVLQEGRWHVEESLPSSGATTASTKKGPLRVWSMTFAPRVEHGDEAERYVLRVAAPLAAFSGLADRVWLGFLLALGVAILLGVAGAAVLAQVFLAPLHRLTTAARTLDATSTSARLDVSGLDPDLKSLADAFNGVLARLATAFEAQRAFTARASHALRTPLAAVLSQAEVALRRERSVQEYKTALDDIAGSARDSAKLVDGLLALSRADATATPERTKVDVNELLAEVKRLFDARAQAKSVDLGVIAPPGLVWLVSRPRLREMLDALLDNALTYTPERGVVRVEATATTLEVRDSGPGISASEREQVFERFFRGSGAQGTSGSGLGLAVVRAIAEAEGAKVNVDTAPEGGACVRVRFSS